jgi:hypothetical protein
MKIYRNERIAVGENIDDQVSQIHTMEEDDEDEKMKAALNYVFNMFPQTYNYYVCNHFHEQVH